MSSLILDVITCVGFFAAGFCIGRTLTWETSNVEPEPLKQCTTLTVRPGDTIVFMTNDCLSTEAAAHIRQMITDTFPGNKAIVLTEGNSLSILCQAPSSLLQNPSNA